jgi:cell division protein FtsB
MLQLGLVFDPMAGGQGGEHDGHVGFEGLTRVVVDRSSLTMSGNPVDIDALHQRISQLEQHNRDLQQQLDECDDDLAAARAANRELMARLNTPSRQR